MAHGTQRSKEYIFDKITKYMIRKIIKFLKTGFKSDNSISFQDGSEQPDVLVEPESHYSGPPFYILKYPIMKKQWEIVMRYSSSVCSWDEMHVFIKKLNEKIGITLELPSSDNWIQACKVYSPLKNNIYTADISFWTYNRPHGTIIDPSMPHIRGFKPCEGTEQLPGDLYVTYGNGHDAIALFLITYDDIEKIADSEVVKTDDFILVTS